MALVKKHFHNVKVTTRKIALGPWHWSVRVRNGEGSGANRISGCPERNLSPVAAVTPTKKEAQPPLVENTDKPQNVN